MKDRPALVQEPDGGAAQSGGRRRRTAGSTMKVCRDWCSVSRLVVSAASFAEILLLSAAEARADVASPL